MLPAIEGDIRASFGQDAAVTCADRRPDSPAGEASDGFDGDLLGIYRRGRIAHPDIGLDFAIFAEFFWTANGGGGDGPTALLAAGDLFLAYACAGGVRGAAARFEVYCGASIDRAVARALPLVKDREEAGQRTRQILLVGERPKISQYRGQGPLAHWVSVVALRVAVSTGRADTAERRLRQRLIADAIGAADPERQLMEREIRLKVEGALTEALNQLERRDRLVLRLHLVSGMSLTAIAKMFRVNHTTVSRRVRRICEGLLNAVAGVLRGGAFRNDDLSSVLGLLASRLDISVSRLLAAD
jgi:RNA polymerase sigma-70 factor